MIMYYTTSFAQETSLFYVNIQSLYAIFIVYVWCTVKIIILKRLVLALKSATTTETSSNLEVNILLRVVCGIQC